VRKRRGGCSVRSREGDEGAQRAGKIQTHGVDQILSQTAGGEATCAEMTQTTNEKLEGDIGLLLNGDSWDKMEKKNKKEKEIQH